jgi:hypothetical protein
MDIDDNEKEQSNKGKKATKGQKRTYPCAGKPKKLVLFVKQHLDFSVPASHSQ